MNKSKVFFIKLDEIEKLKSLFPKFKAPLGVKVHFGEEGNITFIRGEKIKPIVEMLEDPKFVECSVLYKGQRTFAKTHRELALKHGFDYAPIDLLDGEEGDDSIELEINKKHYQKCYLGKGLENYNSLLVISHFKGHMMAGFGGALKNIGMGLASRKGKLALHASIKHKIIKEKCISCGDCIRNCPVEAIKYNKDKKAEIDQGMCISCSKCFSICPQHAVEIPWGSTSKEDLQERVAEYALAAAKGKEYFYINILANITKDCDCISKEMQILTPDIGILASSDPIAIDQASYDMVLKAYPDFEKKYGESQLKHGEEIGLGSRDYELINV